MIPPKIGTAIPKRRYRIGDFSAVILSDVESADGRSYHHILALVADGEQAPTLYVTAEEVPDAENPAGVTVVRVITESGERALGPDARWRDLDLFAEDAIAMVQQVMGLTKEEPMRLL